MRYQLLTEGPASSEALEDALLHDVADEVVAIRGVGHDCHLDLHLGASVATLVKGGTFLEPSDKVLVWVSLPSYRITTRDVL